MSRDELLKLAERVEGLVKPNREVDRSIMEALSLKPDYAADWGPRDNYRPAAFAYTASIDAAMSLVPEGFTFGLYPSGVNFRLAQVWQTRRGYSGFGIDIPEARASRDALALTAASLRARAALISGDEA